MLTKRGGVYVPSKYVRKTPLKKKTAARVPRSKNVAGWNPGTSRSLAMVDPELKYNDTILSSQYNCVLPSSTILLVNGLAVGDDDTNRDGRRVYNDHVEVRGDFYYSSAVSAHAVDQVRGILVYDKQPNGAAPAVTDILAGTGNPDCPYNMNNSGRFDILWDKCWGLPYVPAATTAMVKFPILKEIIPVKRSTQYSGTGSTIANIATGSLYLIWIGSQASGGNNTVVDLSVRIYFRG